MQKRRLGRTELMVSCIGLGAGSRMFMERGYSGPDAPPTVINCALDKGINFIDTARSYYKSEQIIGEAIKGRRDECFLATKTYLRKGSRVEKDIDISLKNLQTDRIDLYQIHNITYKDELRTILQPKGALEMLKKAKEAGKINYIGITGFRPDIMKECIQTGEFDTIQIPFNFIERTQTEKILLLAKRYDLGIIIMRPFLGGLLANSGEAILRFIFSYDVSVVIPGCSTVEHIQMNARIGKDLRPVSSEERESLFSNIGGIFCRGCKVCEQGCPISLSIAEILRWETYLYFNATYARDHYRQHLKKATACIDCGKCEEVCPYNLPIRKMLKTAHQRLMKGKLEDIIVGLLRKLQLYERLRATYFRLGLPLPNRYLSD